MILGTSKGRFFVGSQCDVFVVFMQKHTSQQALALQVFEDRKHAIVSSRQLTDVKIELQMQRADNGSPGLRIIEMSGRSALHR